MYVAGYGHSGSTVLGIVLGNAHGALNLGEVAMLERDPSVLSRSRPAAAPRWASLRTQLADELSRAASDKPGGKPGGKPGSPRGYASVRNAFFSTVEREAGCGLLVDSSKTPVAGLLRPRALRGEGHRVLVVHLVRDPRAVLYSLYRKATRGQRRFTGFKVLIGWIASNIGTAVLCGGTRSAVVSYEAFVTRPGEVLDALSSRLGVDFSAARDALVAEKPLDPGFQINGNRMSRAEVIALKPDFAWQSRAPRRVRVLGALGLPLYRFLTRRSL